MRGLPLFTRLPLRGLLRNQGDSQEGNRYQGELVTQELMHESYNHLIYRAYEAEERR